MSLVRVHNFSVSLDGYGTGAGQQLDAPFGHAGTRLLEWARQLAPLMLDRHPELACKHTARWLGGKSEYLKA